MQPYVTTTGLAVLGLLYAVLAAAIARLALSRPPAMPGCKRLRSGWHHWGSLLGALCFVGLISWVWLFVGSARRDAAFQMNVAFGLILAFGLGAAYVAVAMARLKAAPLCWRGKEIGVPHPGGSIRFLAMADADAARHSLSGYLQFHFKDGTVISVDPYAVGSDELVQEMFEAGAPDGDVKSALEF